MIPAHNPLQSPVVIDRAGRQLGGGDWGQVDPDEVAVQEAEQAHRLILFPGGLPPEADPAILAVVYPESVATPDGSAAAAGPDESLPADPDTSEAAPPARTSARKAAR